MRELENRRNALPQCKVMIVSQTEEQLLCLTQEITVLDNNTFISRVFACPKASEHIKRANSSGSQWDAGTN